MLEEAPDDLPQLVVIDGGVGQLEFARQALAELGLMDRLMVIGLCSLTVTLRASGWELFEFIKTEH